MHLFARLRLSVIVCAAAIAWGSCETREPAAPVGGESPEAPAPAAASARAKHASPSANFAETPSDVARRLQAAAQRGDYETLRSDLVPADRERTVELLRAIEDVTTADAAMVRAFSDAFALLPPGWDLSSVMRDNIGPFSREVTIIREDQWKDAAIVTIQEADHVPLLHLAFVRHEGRWLHRPEPVPAAMTVELTRLARLLRDTVDWARGGADPRVLADAVEYRIMPQLARVVRASDGPAAVTLDSHDSENP